MPGLHYAKWLLKTLTERNHPRFVIAGLYTMQHYLVNVILGYYPFQTFTATPLHFSPPYLTANGLIGRQQTLLKGAHLFDNLELSCVFINFNLIGV